LPYAFTEQGVAMLSSVLRSRRAVLVNVEIMRAFVRLRQILASHAELANNSRRSKRDTTPSLKSSSTPSANSWPRPRPSANESAFRSGNPGLAMDATRPRATGAELLNY
jgi:hypothetical protein